MFAMGYQSRSNEPNLTGFVQHLADGEQEIVYLLARALRRAGEPSGTLEADPKCAPGRCATSPLPTAFGICAP